ncbi:gliding motility-associated C-terminal domain-containing protein [Flavobacterium gilvum]|uniref:Uncharacterized protein n=1 Tax=Flavobacterium gilvum TaxID=1492737 RepID=A0AAC9N510_9FLAO|nr:gliding motility-associated C-terminal domain-containing protein [Flavobacterium gilvum]AOW09041.1 hypothetical protein EM308_05700 [Flavobacterium gilvum]
MKANTLIKSPSLGDILDYSWFFVLFLLTSFSMQAQALSDFTLSVTPSAETCPNNGTLTITTSNTVAGSIITYSITKPDTSLLNTTDQVVSGLSAGTYTVVATQSFGGNSSSKQQTVTIANQVPPSPVFTSSTGGSCNGDITLNVTKGTVVSYTLTNLPGTPAYSKTQAGNVFTNVPPGNYHIVGSDACNQSYGIDVLVNAGSVTFTRNYLADKLSGCGQIKWFNTFGTNTYIAYPLNLKYTITDPDGGADTVINRTVNSGNSSTLDVNDVIPFYDNKAYSVNLKITDACGTVFSFTQNINEYSRVEPSLGNTQCGGHYINLKEKFMNGPYTFAIVTKPAGSTITNNPSVDASGNFHSFGDANTANEPGYYEVDVTDACGITRRATFTIPVVSYANPAPLTYASCTPGKVTFDFYKNPGHFTSVTVTGPGGVVVPASQVSITGNGFRILVKDVDPGTYTVDYTDDCGNHTITYTANAVNEPSYTFNVSKQCGSFYTTLSAVTNNIPGYSNVTYRLEQWNAASSTWILVTDQDSNGRLTGVSGSFFKTGKFRLARYFTSPIPPANLANDIVSGQCVTPLDEFEIGANAIKIDKAFVFWCSSSLANVVLSASGATGNINYSIVKKDGVSFTVNNGTSNIFTNLQEGEYEFHATDDCSNTAVFTVDLNSLNQPKVNPLNLCDGQAGKLSVDGMANMNYSWTKGTNPTVLSTSNILNFPSFNGAVDAGIYHVHLTSNAPNNCIDKVLDFTITSNTSNPNAGTNQTINVCTSSPDVNLDNYLSAGADTYGSWSETTNSGKLAGSFWSPSKAGAGTYTFKYTVNGLCSGTSVATFTIVNTATPAAPTANVTQPTCTVATGTITVTAPPVAAGITYTVTGTNPVVAAVTNSTGVFSGLTPGTYDVTASAGTCMSPATALVVNSAILPPSAPTLGTVTQPTTCAAPNGTFQINAYDATTYTYVVNPSTGVTVSGSGEVTAPEGTYTVTITNKASGCTSPASASVTVDAAPTAPTAPTLGAVTQPTTCAVPNGTFQITGYDAATYTYAFTPSVVSVSATGLVTASAGSYTLKITDKVSGCESASSAAAVVNAAPSAPSAPVLGAVTQPTTCAVPNGTFQITGYDAATYTYAFTPSVVSVSATGLVTASAGSYTLKITDKVSGCESASSAAAVVNAAPSAPSAPVLGAVTQPTTCAVPNGTFQITGYDAATYTYAFTPSVVSVSATGLVTASAGSYTLKITDKVSGCESASSAAAVVNAAPSAPSAPVLGAVTQPTTCAVPNGTFQITGYDAATYTYAFTPSVVSVSATGLVTASAGSYTLKITNKVSGCESASSAAAVVNAAPSAPSAPVLGAVTQPTTCAVPNGTFQITGYDAATYTYAFTPSVVSVSATGLVTASAGSYTLKITDKVSGCESASSAAAVVNAAPSAPSAPVLGAVTQPTTCAVPNGTFQITGYDAATYTYAFTPSVVSVSATGLVTASAGSYTLKITNKVSGCESASSAAAVVNAAPSAPSAPVLGAVTQPTTCAVPNGTFQITGYDAATYTYAFTPSVVSVSATGLVTASAGSYTLKITNKVSGCESASSAAAVVNAAPSAPSAPVLGAVTQPTTCAVPNGTFQINAYDTTTYTYVVNPSTGVTVSGSGEVTAPEGTYTVTITNKASGCTSPASASVTVDAAPTAPAAPTFGAVTQPTTCAVSNGTFQITGYDAATYTYAFTPSVVSVSATGLVTASAGSYTLKITNKVSGCESASSAAAVVNAAPSAPSAPVLGAVTQPTTCAVPNGTFQINAYDTTTYTYVVNPSTGVTVSGSGEVTAPEGTYTVTITNKASGCTSPASASVTVDAAPTAPAAPTFGAVTQPTTCAVSNGTFQITGYDAATYTYAFTPSVVSVSATGLVTASAGSYTLKITNKVSGCESASSAAAVVNAAPSAPSAPVLGAVIQPTTCAVPNGTFQINAYDATAYTYAFTPSVVSVSATGLVTASAGSYTLKITNKVSGCESDSSAAAVVNAAPTAPAAPTLGTVTQPSCASPNGKFQINAYDAATYTYVVSPSAGVMVSGSGLVSAPTGSYTVTITNIASGCVSSASNIVVIESVICAVDDDYSATPINGKDGGTTPNILVNDTLNGAPVVLSDVNLTGVTVPTGLTVNTDGTITVDPNTPAGSYEVVYSICEKLNPTNCDTATVKIAVDQAVIDAVDDDYSATPINGKDGGTTPNILVNDTLNGVPVVLSDVNLTGVTVPTGLTVNPDGTITVDPNTPAGTYEVVYSICEKLNPTNCDTATVKIAVDQAVIDAVDDDYSATPINGKDGGTTPNVLVNDTLNGVPVVPSDVNLTGVTVPTGLTLNPDGTITVDPNTPAGTYEVVYSICEKLNPTNCDTATVKIAVGQAVIDAVDDDYSATPISGKDGGTTPNILVNDTLNGVPVVPSDLNLTGVTVPTGLTLNPDGTITVDPNTPAGSYEVVYSICEKLNPTNCDTATVKIAVGQAVIDAVDDDYSATPINGKDGGTTPNVLVNDTLNGVPVVPSDVNLTGVTVPTGLTLNTDGTITVDPNTPAGTYEVVYSICEKLNPTNCDTATVKIAVGQAVIDAVDDDYSATPINGKDGGTTPNVLVNDTLNGVPVVPSDVNLTGVTVPAGLTLNTDGTITVAPNTPAGSYEVTYSICEKLNPTNCDTATVKIAVGQAVIDAVDDDYSATLINGKEGGTTPNVLVNDTLNGVPVVLSDVNLTGVTVPTGLTVNTDGTITVAPNTPAGTYEVVYSICEKLNPTNCDTATVKIAVGQAVIDAVDDDYSATPINGKSGGTTPNVLVNDTLNGVPVVPSDVNLTGVTVPTGLTLNPDGTITVAPNTPAGSYEVVYSICEKLNPTNCDTATVKIAVGYAVIDAVDDDYRAVPISGKEGGTKSKVLVNDTLNGVPVVLSDVNLTGVTVPAGLTLNPDGTITVAPNTPAGTYEVVYTICEKLNPTNCDTAIATVIVAPAVINAVDDDYSATPISREDGGTTPNILANDTLNGVPVELSDVNLTGVTVPEGLTLNPDGTITVAPNTPSGTYEVVYSICEKLNPTNCNSATVTVVVNDVEVFNALTPNDDGNNDVFTITGLENYPDNTLEVFNRWGVKVYSTEGYGQNGNFFRGFAEGKNVVKQSEGLPSGTYFYVLRYVNNSGVARTRSGYLFLNR